MSDLRESHVMPESVTKTCVNQHEHTWVQRGIHWACSHCSYIPCCTASWRNRRPTPGKRKKLPDSETCYWCHMRFDQVGIQEVVVKTIDHIIPRSQGGLDTAENLVWACDVCNQSRNKYDQRNKDWLQSRSFLNRQKWVQRLPV